MAAAHLLGSTPSFAALSKIVATRCRAIVEAEMLGNGQRTGKMARMMREAQACADTGQPTVIAERVVPGGFVMRPVMPSSNAVDEALGGIEFATVMEGK